jgi:hypothetical protein
MPQHQHARVSYDNRICLKQARGSTLESFAAASKTANATCSWPHRLQYTDMDRTGPDRGTTQITHSYSPLSIQKPHRFTTRPWLAGSLALHEPPVSPNPYAATGLACAAWVMTHEVCGVELRAALESVCSLS